MKTLYILRHAKSSWEDPALVDFDRPLNDRGVHAASFMGELIAQHGYTPEILLCSPAHRARHTAQIIISEAGIVAPIVFDDRIYEASPTALKQVISEVDDSISSIMIIGHNPGMEGLVRSLTGDIQAMPTAALAVVDVSIERWTAIHNGDGILQAVYRPREELAKKNNAFRSNSY